MDIIYSNNIQANDSVYSDRLFQWNPDKHDELCRKHFGDTGQAWTNRSPKQIEEFLRDYTNDQDLQLCKIWYGVNASDGFPYWRFDFKKSSHG